MAKRTYGRTTLERDPEEDDVAREDSADETDTDTGTEDPTTFRPTHKVLEVGSMIDGVAYPRTDVPEELSMGIELDDARAQALVDAGYKLQKIGEDEPLQPTPKEESTEEVEPESKL